MLQYILSNSVRFQRSVYINERIKIKKRAHFLCSSSANTELKVKQNRGLYPQLSRLCGAYIGNRMCKIVLSTKHQDSWSSLYFFEESPVLIAQLLPTPVSNASLCLPGLKTCWGDRRAESYVWVSCSSCLRGTR